ncbi:MAG: type II secretion system protein GspL [Pseudohongiella sp.]|nr:type II secretion system protein GspL [Pseudohongiella sp.]MDO9520750.1 type II secretion system protein GspL [Pseudohongiella sp.]MDP2126965.1 type II secretion system protein GspL [Pseudohongiella sp.]
MKNTILVQLEESADTERTARWCLQDKAGAKLQSGSFDAFKNWLDEQQRDNKDVLRVRLLLSGEQVVTRSVAIAANEKKHLPKLLPFMLESQLAVDLSQVHVAFVPPQAPQTDHGANTVLVAYTDKKQLQWRVAALESLGLEVGEIVSIPALLPEAGNIWPVLLDSDICHLKAGDKVCTSMEPQMLPVLIDVAIAETAKFSLIQPPATLTIYAGDSQSEYAYGQAILQTLKEYAGLKSAGIVVSLQPVTNLWGVLETTGNHVVNLRQGEFAAPLRLAKYWKQWRVPAIAAVVAITAVLVAAIVETQINQYRFRALEARIEQRYRQAMPEGVLVDAVQQLSTQVAQRRSAGSAQSLITMLDAMLEPFESADGLNLHRLSYNSNTQTGGTAAEIQMTVSAPGTAEILTLSENLSAAGWTAQARNISRAGDRQQASLSVRGNGL